MKKDLTIALAWSGGILLLSLIASYAHSQGWIERDTMIRVVALNGLMIVYYGNRAPKVVGPNACARQLTRFAGWSMVLSGLVYAGLWAFAPIPVAATIGTGAVAVGVIATIAYGLRMRGQIRAAGGGGGATG